MPVVVAPCSIDFEQAHDIAEAFLDAPRASSSAIVRAAYADLATQVFGTGHLLTRDSH